MDTQSYVFQQLFHTPTPPRLGPEIREGVRPTERLDGELQALRDVIPPHAHELIRALAYLWHDHLDPAHALAQSIESADGSYLHGMVHRREPDYSNARYWFNRVGHHPCFEPLRVEAVELLQTRGEPDLAARLAPMGQWDPFSFIDACATAVRIPKSDPMELVRQVQALEFRVLLRYFLQLPAQD